MTHTLLAATLDHLLRSPSKLPPRRRIPLARLLSLNMVSLNNRARTTPNTTWATTRLLPTTRTTSVSLFYRVSLQSDFQTAMLPLRASSNTTPSPRAVCTANRTLKPLPQSRRRPSRRPRLVSRHTEAHLRTHLPTLTTNPLSAPVVTESQNCRELSNPKPRSLTNLKRLLVACTTSSE